MRDQTLQNQYAFDYHILYEAARVAWAVGVIDLWVYGPKVWLRLFGLPSLYWNFISLRSSEASRQADDGGKGGNDKGYFRVAVMQVVIEEGKIIPSSL